MQDLRSDQAREIKDEERAQRAREREERLQRSIQSTLKKLGNTLDSSHKQLDERRSNRPQSKSKHPDKPNKFWAASMQKVADGKKPPSKQMMEDDAPRPTAFPDLEEFLGKTPDDSTQFQKSPRRESPKSGKLKQAQEMSPVLSPSDNNEDEEEEAEVISLNQDADDAMEFEDRDQSPEESPQLMVNLNNLLGGNTPDQKNIANDKNEDRETITQNEFQYNKRSTKRKSKRKSMVKDPANNQLFDFFKSLDYRPDNKNEKSTVRASYKSGRASYSLFGVPSQKPGEKGQVYVQSQDGFNKDLPPVRLSENQRDELMQNFQELERLSSMNDESEDEALEESPDKTDKSKRAIPLTPNIDSRKKEGNLQKNNKTFWSSGVEKPNNFQEPRAFGEKSQKPFFEPQVIEFKSMAEKNKIYQNRTKTPTLRNDEQKKAFLAEYEKLMGGGKHKSGVTPATPKEEQTTPWAQEPVQDVQIQKKGVLKHVYNGMLSSMLGGFGGFSGTTPGAIEDSNSKTPGQNEPPQEKIQPSQMEDQRQSEFFLKVTPRDRSKSPLSSRPKHNRFGRVQNQPNYANQHSQPVPVQSQQQPFDYKQKDPFQNPNARESLKSMHTESMSGKSPSRRRSKKTPIVMKLTSEDFDHGNKRNLETPPFGMGNRFKDEPDMNLTITPSSQIYGTPGRSMSFASPPIQKAKEPQSREEIQNHAAIYQDDSDLNLPNVIILVAPNVKLIRNNSVPMLQVQLEIIQNALSYDSDMCMLGLNDVIYIVPEFTPAEYDITYARSCNGNEYDDYQPFFHHFTNYVYDPHNDKVNIPERMKGLNKNQMTAIERDHYEPDLRGKAFINLKNIPNGHYTIFYLRIGQPISINSRLKVLGMAKNIYVNINRDKISKNKKPQLDLNHSSSRISKRETSKFKILKAKASKRRDNKVLSLDSDGEDESSDEADPSLDKIDKKVSEEYHKLFKKESEETRPGSNQEHTLEMEFDEIGKDTMGGSSGSRGNDTPQPAPLQDSKEYYNSTQKMTEAMIQNPQFQIFPIDEEDSMRTSQRDSTREDPRQSEEVRQLQRQLDGYTPGAIETPDASTPGPNAPEDAFRNVHRSTEDGTVRPTQTNRPTNGEQIADQIGNYQQEAMAQLAALMNANPMSAKASSIKNESSYRVPAENSQSKNMRRDSAKNSQGSGRASSRSGRKSTRVKTISLRDLEDPPVENKKQQPLFFPEQQLNQSPKRDRSQSHGNSRNSNRAYEEAKARGRSRSSGPRLSADNRYPSQEFDNMRDTAKIRPLSRGQNMQQQPFQENQNMRNIDDNQRPIRTPNTERIDDSRGSQRSRSNGGKRPWAGNRGASSRRSGLGQRSQSRPQSRPRPQQELDENSADIRPKSEAYQQQDNSMRSPRRPISSASGDRNRFFKTYDSQSKRSGSRGGQDRSPIREPDYDDRKKRSQNSFINPNQFLGQQSQPNMNPGYHNGGDQFKPKPQSQPFTYDENFSDDNQSPVRPGFIQTQQTAPLRDERNRGLKKGERRQPRF